MNRDGRNYKCRNPDSGRITQTCNLLQAKRGEPATEFSAEGGTLIHFCHHGTTTVGTDKDRDFRKQEYEKKEVDRDTVVVTLNDVGLQHLADVQKLRYCHIIIIIIDHFLYCAVL